MLAVAKRDYELSSGEIISIGFNFRALELMSQYPGGLNKLKKNMDAIATVEPESDEYGEMVGLAFGAMGYMLHALIRAGGTKCSYEDAMMAISPSDFEQLHTIFEEFSEAMQSMPGNARGLMNRA